MSWGLSKARLGITALFVDYQSPAEVAARYEAEAEAAFGPRSRRPKTSPGATPPETVELVLRLRKHLLEDGHAGADTLGWHLAQHHAITLARATIYRILTLHGAVTPEPKKETQVVLHPVRSRDAEPNLGGPARPVRRQLQPAPAAPLAATPGHPGGALQPAAQSHARAEPRHRDPRPVRHDRVDKSGTVTLRV